MSDCNCCVVCPVESVVLRLMIEQQSDMLFYRKWIPTITLLYVTPYSTTYCWKRWSKTGSELPSLTSPPTVLAGRLCHFHWLASRDLKRCSDEVSVVDLATRGETGWRR